MILDCVLWQRQQSRQVCGKSSLFGISDGRIRRWHNEICEPSAGPAGRDGPGEVATAFHPTDPSLPIPQHVVMGMLVVLMGTILALIIKSRLSVEKPGGCSRLRVAAANPMGFGIKDCWKKMCTHGAAKLVPFGRIDFYFHSVCQI